MKERVRRDPSGIVNDEFTHRVLGCGIRIHKRLGIGLTENAYETYYCNELTRNGFLVDRQRPLPAYDFGVEVDLAYVPDLIVDNRLIIELKTVKKLIPEFDAQLLTYLKFSGISVGLLMNFHAYPLMSGVRRLVWNHQDPQNQTADRDFPAVPPFL
jgi:GxxExxY protein